MKMSTHSADNQNAETQMNEVAPVIIKRKRSVAKYLREAQALRQQVEESTRMLEEERKKSCSLQSELLRHQQEARALRKEADDCRNQCSKTVELLCREKKRTFKEVRKSNLLINQEKERVSEIERAAFQAKEDAANLNQEIQRLRESHSAFRRECDEEKRIAQGLVEQLKADMKSREDQVNGIISDQQKQLISLSSNLKLANQEWLHSRQETELLRMDVETFQRERLLKTDTIQSQQLKVIALTNNIKLAYTDRSRFRREAEQLRKEVDNLNTPAENIAVQPLTVDEPAPEKKVYDRSFLLQLQDHPSSMKRHNGLSLLDFISDIDKMESRESDSIPPEPKETQLPPPSGHGGPSPVRIREFKLKRQERPEEPQNAWKPRIASKKDEALDPVQQTAEFMKKIRSILNKLTPTNMDRLLQRIKELQLDINTEERLAGVVELFFEKIVAEPVFSPTYASMCNALLQMEVPSSVNPAEMITFRMLLLRKCQSEFKKASAGDHKQSLGNVRFIGELFKLGIISLEIMKKCISALFAQPDDEESLERLCTLLNTVGKDLEQQLSSGNTYKSTTSGQKVMDPFFSSLEAVGYNRKISNRTRFMIQDVIDLRKKKWEPRREENKPETIKQIRKK